MFCKLDTFTTIMEDSIIAKNQGPRRSDEEWFRLINECRRSGLSDSLWCKQQGIPASSFFSAVRRLREKAYALPERERSIDIVSNPLPCQDVVRIDILLSISSIDIEGQTKTI